MRFSSYELDGCDFATEEDFANPAKKGGYDEATRVVNNIQVDSNYIFSNFNHQSNPSNLNLNSNPSFNLNLILNINLNLADASSLLQLHPKSQPHPEPQP